MKVANLLSALGALLLAGCQSYEIVQSNVFSDEDGNSVMVEYGRSSTDHVNTFLSPQTGEEMEFKSKLVVLVTLPDGERFKAWQCMNFINLGTMYKTDDGEWMFLANGFSSIVYRQAGDDKDMYKEVYRGVLCDTPKRDVKRNDKWKVVKPTFSKGAATR